MEYSDFLLFCHLAKIVTSFEKSINKLKKREITETNLEDLKEKVCRDITDFAKKFRPNFKFKTLLRRVREKSLNVEICGLCDEEIDFVDVNANLFSLTFGNQSQRFHKHCVKLLILDKIKKG